jgi:hypothetical protein
MYSDHVPLISKSMRNSEDCFCNAVMFAVLSARVKFDRVPNMCRDLRAKGVKCKALWGWKLDAYKYLQEHREDLWKTCIAAPYTRQGAIDCISALTTIPGMGIVKAAFVAQMLGHNVACLDTRNIQRDGRNPRAYKTDSKIKKQPRMKRLIEHYVSETWGTAQYYWDTWCNEVGPDYGMTPEGISLKHVVAVAPTCFVPMRKAAPAAAEHAIPF